MANLTVFTLSDEDKGVGSKTIWSGITASVPNQGEFILLSSLSGVAHEVVTVVHRLEDGEVDIFLEPDVDGLFQDLDPPEEAEEEMLVDSSQKH